MPAGLNLHYSSVILRNLTSAGVENNLGLGPFAMRKVVQASHHKSDIIRYGSDAARKQCTANAYFAIIFSSIKRVSLWKAFDLHYVLEQRDKIFRKVCEDKKRYERVLMFLQGDLHMKVFCLQKRITGLKIIGITVRAIEGMGQFSHVIDTVLQQYGLKITYCYFIHSAGIHIGCMTLIDELCF